MKSLPLAVTVTQIATDLAVPKSRYNSHGKYHYRSVEDIVEAAKVALAAHGLGLHMTDEVVEVGGRCWLKATVTVTDGEQHYISEGWAEIPTEQKGMNAPQITGAASSYARKYALGGMLLVDGGEDADHGNASQPQARVPNRGRSNTPKTRSGRTGPPTRSNGNDQEYQDRQRVLAFVTGKLEKKGYDGEQLKDIARELWGHMGGTILNLATQWDDFVTYRQEEARKQATLDSI